MSMTENDASSQPAKKRRTVRWSDLNSGTDDGSAVPIKKIFEGHRSVETVPVRIHKKNRTYKKMKYKYKKYNRSINKYHLMINILSIYFIQDKWRLLPAFLKAKGLVKQHVDSYNFFVTIEIKQIVRAHANRRITSDVDKNFYIE